MRASGSWQPTAVQLRILNEVRRKPGATYNGLARKAIERLALQGLVSYEFDLVAHAKGGGIEFTQQFTVFPA